ncbi:MAG TPA: acyl-CoA dehydrogenase family protein [Polyangiaceae bacterium]|nr:acyl-CoA dehydrogenase family protein [Polyangiaceae bacterium]
MSGSDSMALGASFLWEKNGVRPIMAPEAFTEEQQEIARSARKFSETQILPRAAQIESKKSGLVPELLRKAGELGLLMVDIPPEYGGLGLDKTTSMLIAEEFSALGSFAVSLGAHTGIGTMPILYFGTPEQKAQYLPDLATGKRFAAYALTESSSGSDALSAKSRADLSADGSYYLLNGTKQFITNAAFADVFTVFAQIGGNKFSAFIVDRTSPGLSVGPEEHKLGIRGSSTCSLTFEDVKVPASNLLGEVGKGHRIAFNILNVGRIKLGVGTIGAAKRALAVSARYASERQQFGKPIGAFGLVASKLAEMAVGIFVGETMGYRTTGLIDAKFGEGGDDSAHVDAIEEFAVEASIIKVFGSEVLDYCADECVQIHGGYGFVEEYEAERLFRDSRINRIFEGTNEINRLIVPATILKRAMKGQVPLLARVQEIRELLEKGEVPRPAEGEFGIATQVAEFGKWIATYVLAVAAETYHVNIADEQEILGALADIVTQAYALDSVVTRVKQIVAGSDELNKGVARDLLVAFAPPAYSFCVHTARHVLMDVCDEESLPKHLDAIGKMRIDWPSKVIAAKRRLARSVLEAGGYPLRRPG